MTLRFLISLNLLLLLALTARAQTADEFFNGGAQLYISNNIPAALEKTENGLKLYPDNVKLQKLEKLLKQQQQSQSQQNQQQQNQQNQQSQKNQSQQKQSQQQKNQNSQAQNQQQQNQQKQNQENQQNEKQNSQQQSQSQEKSGEKKNEPTNAMTPQEAKQLLDAQKGDEQFLQLKPKGQPENPNPPVKDW
jgi:hypothetical protein